MLALGVRAAARWVGREPASWRALAAATSPAAVAASRARSLAAGPTATVPASARDARLSSSAAASTSEGAATGPGGAGAARGSAAVSPAPGRGAATPRSARRLVLYDTLTRKKRPFEPLDPSGRLVRLYVCGVTVYDLAHVGHARSAVVYDVLVRLLGRLGYRVVYCRNFTDVDDKIIARAAREGVTEAELSERYIFEFHRDVDALGCLPPTLEPRATEHIDAVVNDIARIIANGHAYAVKRREAGASEGQRDAGAGAGAGEGSSDVFFEVSTLRSYGALSGRTPGDNRAGERVAVDGRKRAPEDFALWKAAEPGEPSWQSPWGRGRPGWHIECSAMIRALLAPSIDIHGGGSDLVFPHHENERAQALAAEGRGRRAFAAGHESCGGGCQAMDADPGGADSPQAAPALSNFWVHNGFVTVGDEKMSKSLGNFCTVRDALERYHPAALRWMLLATHYRQPLAFGQRQLDEASDRIYAVAAALAAAREAGAPANDDGGGEGGRAPPPAGAGAGDADPPPPPPAAMRALLDDLGTPGVVAAISAPLKRLNDLLRGKGGGAGAGAARRAAQMRACAADILGSLALLGIDGADPGLLVGLRELTLRRAGVTERDVEVALAERAAARARGDWAAADAARARLEARGLAVMDGAGGTTWRPLPLAS